MTTAHAMAGELSHHRMLVDELRRRFPDASEDTIADTVAGMTDLDEMLAEVARSAADDKAVAAVCRLRMEDLAIRTKRHDDRAEAKREAIANTMAAAGIKKVMAPDLTLSLSAGKPKVLITNEAQVIADGFGKQPPAVVDKAALRAALEAGNQVIGATLGNAAPVLTVRTK